MTIGEEVFPVTEVGLGTIGEGEGVSLIVVRTTIKTMKMERISQPNIWMVQGVSLLNLDSVPWTICNQIGLSRKGD